MIQQSSAVQCAAISSRVNAAVLVCAASATVFVLAAAMYVAVHAAVAAAPSCSAFTAFRAAANILFFNAGTLLRRRVLGPVVTLSRETFEHGTHVNVRYRTEFWRLARMVQFVYCKRVTLHYY